MWIDIGKLHPFDDMFTTFIKKQNSFMLFHIVNQIYACKKDAPVFGTSQKCNSRTFFHIFLLNSPPLFSESISNYIDE